ncbi:hypothetical protein BD289DRAFT_470646 [Coniella lustricola]|uniref:Protein FAF1 n=1 Tax=Coniella lustricola TaxID=2025994 RepID=A0A2T3AN71_9PEZI|nr:hypothetical protein BD289DRAFT_470646 [Coniella lustricola]
MPASSPAAAAAVLGKRKRKPAQIKDEKTPDAAATAAVLEDAQAIFRRHFEAQFAPIDDDVEKKDKSKAKKSKSTAAADEDGDEQGDGIEDMRSDSGSSDDENEDEDGWGGLSGEEDNSDNNSEVQDLELADLLGNSNSATTVEVVDHSKPMPTSILHPSNAIMSKREMRAYLSSRPPDTTTIPSSSTTDKNKNKNANDDDDNPQNEDSKTLLANDLELQRLISESHILAASNPFNAIGSSSSSQHNNSDHKTAFAQGRTRALTIDLRLQKLGSTDSIFTQRKMPTNMRRGINAAREAKEDKRRREAKENGIILEKRALTPGKTKQSSAGPRPSKWSKGGGRRGGLAVDMPGMGRFSNGELKLSKKEVRAVEMEGMRSDSGKRRRRRR